MENKNNTDDLIRESMAPEKAAIRVPSVLEMRARLRVSESHKTSAEADIFLMIAAFLNMKVKLYHAVIAFLVIWLSVLMFTGKEESSDLNVNTEGYYHSNIAAAHNHSASPSCIQTYVLKK